MSRKNTETRYFSYDNIPLKVFIDISNSADYSLLCISGQADADIAYDKYEAIIRKNGQMNGTLEFESYLTNYTALAKYMADYNAIKAALGVLLYFVDNAYIAFLNKKGYRINTDTASGYAKSLVAAGRKADNLQSKIASKIKEMERKGVQNSGGPRTFDDVMAELTASIGFNVPEEVTLARYNGYMKVIKDRNKKK